MHANFRPGPAKPWVNRANGQFDVARAEAQATLHLMSGTSEPKPHLLWTAAGLLSLGTGIIGIFLPLLPTTPLVLLAAFCFGKGSPRLRRWLLAHKRFGPMIEDWQKNGAIAPRAKRAAVIAMAVTLAISVALGLSIVLIAIQATCLAGAAGFILTRPDA